MALHTKIKHVDKRRGGVLRFRRRLPKDVAQALGEGYLQVHIRSTDPSSPAGEKANAQKIGEYLESLRFFYRRGSGPLFVSLIT